jgi:hypothetical protein
MAVLPHQGIVTLVRPHLLQRDPKWKRAIGPKFLH